MKKLAVLALTLLLTSTSYSAHAQTKPIPIEVRKQRLEQWKSGTETRKEWRKERHMSRKQKHSDDTKLVDNELRDTKNKTQIYLLER